MKNQSGFTLIELVIVLVIIGILSTVAVPQLSTLRDQAELTGVASVLGSEAHNQFSLALLEGEDLDDWKDSKVCKNIDDEEIELPSFDEDKYKVNKNGGPFKFSVPIYDDGMTGSTLCSVEAEDDD